MDIAGMKMKILENYDELEGKTIAFTHFAQFADRFTIATTDGCIFMATMSENCDGGEILVYSDGQVQRELHFDPWMRNELSKRGLFDLEAYREKVEADKKRQKQEWARKKREKELEELKRLKEKYESEE